MAKKIKREGIHKHYTYLTAIARLSGDGPVQR